MSIVAVSYYYVNMATIYEILGKNIKALRKAQGWSQATLAEKADVSVPYITMIELAQRSASLEVIQLIATAFSVSVSTLFEEEIRKERIPTYSLDLSEGNFGHYVAAESPYDFKLLEDILEKRIKKLVDETLEDYKKSLC